MKYAILIGDGMSDTPLKELGGKTPLEVAKTPNLDYLAQNGVCGWVNNVPSGMPPGSDVAAMSIFGYDPKKDYSGRGPLEAASLGVKLKKDEVAFRCNLVTVKDGLMNSFTAGHISTEEAKKIIGTLNKKIGTKGIKFYAGLSYRHLLILSSRLSSGLAKAECVPPHDITGKPIEKYLPNNKLLKFLMKTSIMPLLEHPVNIERIKKAKKPASMIWLWGQGEAPQIESFKKKYKKTGAVITAVHLLKGLGKILGLEVIDVPGATGFLDTNYKGKADAALKALKKHDVVFVHVEAPDECGHMGDVKGKIKAIEDFDKLIVGKILSDTRVPGYPDIRILVLPDHPTPIKLMTHTSDPVPFVIYSSSALPCLPAGRKGLLRVFRAGGASAPVRGYNERALKNVKLKVARGPELLRKLFK